ncbi:metal ABC transporter solute-binding protein, Zn/Mn family [Saccharospirillum alexandrii]|uniref:metal ABC transporter solute-binding protein, Zn/Mn family n=1 Tax=Saccharospirillum alexandrii TaxID=2448477 RepID=UPI000FD801DB|nr:zinc ABC transporter substrate-binding protein [Saccharospirillum alexandrii]
MRVLRWIGVAIFLSLTTSVSQAGQLRVVASFSVLGDMVDEIAGDRVTLDILVGPNGDSHVYEPSPQDAVAISRADLVVLNGLSFEGWMPRLMDTADFKGEQLVLGEHIEPLEFGGDDHEQAHQDEEHHEEHNGENHTGEHKHEDEHHHNHGEFDPHAWHSLPHAMTYVSVITDTLADMDPENARYYRQRGDRYRERLHHLHDWATDAMARIPESRRRIITPHDAYGYLEHEYGLHIESPQGLSTESEASARRLGELILQVRMNNISAVFLENVASDNLIRQIERDAKVTFGGTLYSDALSEPSGPAATYEAMMRHNLETLINALQVPAP